MLETTGKVVGERRLRTLRELAALGGADSVARAAADAASVLAQADKDIPFAAIYQLDAKGSKASLLAAAGVAAGSPPAPFEIGMAPGLRQAVWPLGRMCDAGLTIRIDAQDNVAVLPTGAWDDPPNTVLLIPIFAATQDAPIAALVAGAKSKRPLDDEHRGFFELVAKQIGNSFADAMALEEERKRAAALGSWIRPRPSSSRTSAMSSAPR